MDRITTSILAAAAIVFGILLIPVPSLLPDQQGRHGISDASPHLEIAFDYQRQSGIASNQFAVWIEDAAGRPVKTLYATRFTATGGWRKRKASLPQWVAAVRPETLSSQRIDAMTGATPAGGRLRYTWDLTDENGDRVSRGTYRYVLEANLRWDNRVVYSDTIEVGGPTQHSRPKREFTGDAGPEQEMIRHVAATYVP
jgi:hypothetical protein